MNYPKITQYACAVLLVLSSITLASYQAIQRDDIASGLLVYIAQALLFAGSVFGLDYYVKVISNKLNNLTQNGRNKS